MQNNSVRVNNSVGEGSRASKHNSRKPHVYSYEEITQAALSATSGGGSGAWTLPADDCGLGGASARELWQKKDGDTTRGI